MKTNSEVTEKEAHLLAHKAAERGSAAMESMFDTPMARSRAREAAKVRLERAISWIDYADSLPDEEA